MGMLTVNISVELYISPLYKMKAYLQTKIELKQIYKTVEMSASNR